MVSFEMNDRKKIGLGLTGFGVFFSFLGIIFFFDKGLIAMGNGTAAFGAGFFFVIIGWPILGMILEAYGFIVLFSGFWPTLSVFLQKIPILGWIFQQPFVRSFFDRYRGKRVPV
ncbi:vesicle transport protein GOT1-like isoform X2 [Solanum stenotomum]|uniref:vesicle transport protein GOT1-like isoform X2 n=1 Tax=Solanum stenotomum TaxID=172797 RepID=UPI0020D0A89C|nr:vesicle transport protein GOT1-like isoform X2 [Solanum stenotomum]